MIINEWIELKTDPEFFDLVWKAIKPLRLDSMTEILKSVILLLSKKLGILLRDEKNL